MYLEDGGEQVALCELLDRVLNKGIVLAGHVTISVADVDLIYLGLQLVLTSIGSVEDRRGADQPPAGQGKERAGATGAHTHQTAA